MVNAGPKQSCIAYMWAETKSDNWQLALEIDENAASDASLADMSNRDDIKIQIISRWNAPNTQNRDALFKDAIQRSMKLRWVFDRMLETWIAPRPSFLRGPLSLPIDKNWFSVRFGTPDWGWLPVIIDVGGFHIGFRASTHYPPFKDLIKWLEDIIEDKNVRWTAHLEGWYVHLTSISYPNMPFVRFIAETTGAEPAVHIDAHIPKSHLISIFYWSLRSFAHSPLYIERHWAFIRMRQDLSERFPDFPFAELENATPQLINALIRYLYPDDYCRTNCNEALDSKVRNYLANFDPEVFPMFLEHGSQHSRLFVDTDYFETVEQRREELEDLFDDGIYASWEGEDLTSLRSDIIESYLQGQTEDRENKEARRL